ncbi:TetR/AcrR family transcriptional regulator [Actinomarinicola tropica]|uniref:TetR family transcriptional regulator n=1 Tax=Actinomarinicola tropica TaxID=2789776 RepID=A0A5Q2RI43_9ACTN|nr:TetR/AcrR family transcriptional regulator [Actinomarinicola tropica]QGG94231.1 TetR family transcriptional regulator [Actinomarinicola tropica]
MRNAAATRERIVACADDEFYEHGVAATSFSSLAARTGIAKGNFHYHFRAKDDLLRAVIERRTQRTAEMLAEWEQDEDSPAGRIGRFIDIVITNMAPIIEHGCPVGSLCAELAKADHPMRDDAASILDQFRAWLRQQFAALGDADLADERALHVLMRSQGIALLAQVHRDASFVRREAQLLHAWLAEITTTDDGRTTR